MGVRAITINSDNQDEWTNVEAAMQRNEVDILLISPERLANERFRTEVLAGVAGRIALLVMTKHIAFRTGIPNSDPTIACWSAWYARCPRIYGCWQRRQQRTTG